MDFNFFFYFSGENRIYIFSDFYCRMCHENSGVRIRSPSGSVSEKRMESSRFHHSCYRVSINRKKVEIVTKYIELSIHTWKYEKV